MPAAGRSVPRRRSRDAGAAPTAAAARFAYALSPCGPRRAAAHGVTHLLYLCRAEGATLTALALRDALPRALARRSVRHVVCAGRLYVRAPGEETRPARRIGGTLALPLVGGVLEARDRDEAEEELALALAQIA